MKTNYITTLMLLLGLQAFSEPGQTINITVLCPDGKPFSAHPGGILKRNRLLAVSNAPTDNPYKIIARSTTGSVIAIPDEYAQKTIIISAENFAPKTGCNIKPLPTDSQSLATPPFQPSSDATVTLGLVK